MHPVLATCQYVLQILRGLILGVRGVEWVCPGRRKGLVSAAMARRLRAGVRLVEVYLRRVLLEMALGLEPSLAPGPAALRRGRRGRRRRFGWLPVFKVLDESYQPFTGAVSTRLEEARVRRRYWRAGAGKPVFIGGLLQRLDLLAGIAADPMPRAGRLAWHLARCREGPIIAPDLHYRPPGPWIRLWTTEASATFDAMGYAILERSKARPPPLPSRRPLVMMFKLA